MKTPQEIIQTLITLKLSQSEIGRIAGIPQPTINRILKGVTKSPSFDLAMRLNAVWESHGKTLQRRAKRAARYAQQKAQSHE